MQTVTRMIQAISHRGARAKIRLTAGPESMLTYYLPP
jgi:hypothetical protein